MQKNKNKIVENNNNNDLIFEKDKIKVDENNKLDKIKYVEEIQVIKDSKDDKEIIINEDLKNIEENKVNEIVNDKNQFNIKEDNKEIKKDEIEIKDNKKNNKNDDIEIKEVELNQKNYEIKEEIIKEDIKVKEVFNEDNKNKIKLDENNKLDEPKNIEEIQVIKDDNKNNEIIINEKMSNKKEDDMKEILEDKNEKNKEIKTNKKEKIKAEDNKKDLDNIETKNVLSKGKNNQINNQKNEEKKENQIIIIEEKNKKENNNNKIIIAEEKKQIGEKLDKNQLLEDAYKNGEMNLKNNDDNRIKSNINNNKKENEIKDKNKEIKKKEKNKINLNINKEEKKEISEKNEIINKNEVKNIKEKINKDELKKDKGKDIKEKLELDKKQKKEKEKRKEDNKEIINLKQDKIDIIKNKENKNEKNKNNKDIKIKTDKQNNKKENQNKSTIKTEEKKEINKNINIIENNNIIEPEKIQKSNNKEIIDIFNEIKDIKNNKNSSKKEKDKEKEKKEELIINENNINLDININMNQKENKKIEIIENYFDFHMHDIELLQIESYYKTYKRLSSNDIKIIKLIITKYNKFISENLNQTTYPYLINSIKPQFDVLESDIKKKFFLIQILSQKNTIKKKLFQFFKNLTKINLYGVSDRLISIFNKDIFENKNFDIFSEKLSKWHCHVEIIALYIDILSTIFNDHFDFNKQNFSLDSNYKSDTNILIRKNFYKLAGKLCSYISFSPGIDYQKLFTFALTILSTGLSGGVGVLPITMHITQQQLAKIIGVLGFNFLSQKASTELKSASSMQEFNALSKLVDVLNQSLLKIEKTCYRLIVLELQEEIYSNLETSTVDIDIKMKKEEISNLLEVYLKGVNCPDNIEQKIEEEYTQLNASIVEEKWDNEWIIQHLSVHEVDNKNKINNDKNKDKNKDININKSNKEKKNKVNEKENNIFDDFVDINKDDFN